jgi:hypothetical protein
LVVIDLDRRKQGEIVPPRWNQPGVDCGEDVFYILCAEAGEAPPVETFTVETPSGGKHLYYQAPQDIQLGNTSGDRGRGLGWKIDTRARGGFVVGPGSVINSRTYVVAENYPVATLPAWIAERLASPEPETMGTSRELLSELQRKSGYAAAALRGEIDELLSLAGTQGSRNHTLNQASYAIGQLAGAALIPEHLARDALLAAATAIGLPDRESSATIRSGLTAGAQHPRTVA